MAKIKFTNLLRRFYPHLAEQIEVPGNTIAQVLEALNQQYPGIRDYLVDERGKLRQHVNIFIGEELIQDKDTLQDTVEAQDEVFILQAISGG
ncbi:MoaD/ThiS family protein [uncultured Microscilla sp.]|uniref:MoaD/ThiS family protein n=1 Tax=uncultured Microscilla sp. TaxID=432653 RepID=UPI00262B1412|nr:MoaD/ThiS family protein [uncultured Microscilla sp.]